MALGGAIDKGRRSARIISASPNLRPRAIRNFKQSHWTFSTGFSGIDGIVTCLQLGICLLAPLHVILVVLTVRCLFLSCIAFLNSFHLKAFPESLGRSMLSLEQPKRQSTSIYGNEFNGIKLFGKGFETSLCNENPGLDMRWSFMYASGNNKKTIEFFRIAVADDDTVLVNDFAATIQPFDDLVSPSPIF